MADRYGFVLPVSRIFEFGSQEVEIILISLAMLPSDSSGEFVFLISPLIRENVEKTLLLWTIIAIGVNE